MKINKKDILQAFQTCAVCGEPTTPRSFSWMPGTGALCPACVASLQHERPEGAGLLRFEVADHA